MARAGCRGGAARRIPEAGFTFVEVLAAIVILLIATTAVFATFTTQQKSFTVQTRVAEMQQNLRQGAEYMMRDIRMAGYGVPLLPDNVTIPNGVVAAGVTSIRGIYALDSTTGPDQVFVFYQYDMDTSQPPALLSSPMGAPSTPISVDNVFGFGNGDLILVSSGTTADLFQITGAPAAPTLPHDASGYNAVAAHPAFPAAGYASSPPATVAKARFARYYIDSTTDAAHPTLMVDRMAGAAPQPVADDIEDMQLTYGIDANADGIVEAWTPSPGTPSQVRQVQLQLLARARVPDASWSETRPALGNRAGGTTADGYRRRILDVVTDVRNAGF
jgi:prepilin-type N-terminal cleavage/methylation domain-containing protein